MKAHTLLFALMLSVVAAFSQPAGWTYKAPVTIISNGSVHTDYQVAISLNTADLISSGKLQSGGEDLRFGSNCGDTLYDFWIESGINTANTVIWIKVPYIPAAGNKVISVFYGNPTAPDIASFALTFPGAYVSGGSSTTLSGVHNYDWFQLDAGDTLYIGVGSKLTLNASRKCIINGIVWGKGRGYQAPAINTAGTGPGGGGTSTNSGSGGGSYAGIGGTGGYDSGDTPGTGGPAYGTTSGTDLDMGSSGGSGTNMGGSGGGAIEIHSEIIVLNGSINVDGTNGGTDGTGRCGGGGSGGGVMLTAETISGSGAISANGGAGGTGTSTANDSGGGGGGGRIKIFYDNSASLLTTTATGGIGGPNGTAAPGQPGTAGSISTTYALYDNLTTSAGAEFIIPILNIVYAPATPCDGDSVSVSALSGFSTFLWNTGETSETVYIQHDDTLYVAAADITGCVSLDTVTVAFKPLPVVTITDPGLQLCPGDSVVLKATGGFPAYAWSTGSTADSAFAAYTDQYSITVTAVNGCYGTASFFYTSLPAPTPTITVYINTLDAGAGFITYQWYKDSVMLVPETSQTINTVPYGFGKYEVLVSNSDGCTGSSELEFLTTSANETDLLSSLNIYPVPTTQNLNIEFVSPDATAFTIRLSDICGKVLYEEKGSGNGSLIHKNISTAALATGFYFIEITNGNEVSVRKIAKASNK